MKKIFTATLGVMMLLPVLASAATFSFSPAIGTYTKGQTISTSVYVNPGSGETITATKVSLTFPKDKLEVLSYTPVNGSPILAHVGTKTDNATGKIEDNVAFNPGITASTKIATITFKAKENGVANVAVASDAKLLDAGNTNKSVGAAKATFTVNAPAPTPETKPQPKPQPKPSAGADTSSNAGKKPARKPQEEQTASETETATTSTTTEVVATTTATTSAENELDQTAAVAGASSGWIKKFLYGLGFIALLALLLLAFKRRKKNN